MEPTRVDLEALDCESLIARAETAGVVRARVLTRPELVDLILYLSFFFFFNFSFSPYSGHVASLSKFHVSFPPANSSIFLNCQVHEEG